MKETATEVLGILTARGAACRYAIPRATWLEWVALGLAPRPDRTPDGIAVWRLETLVAWEQKDADGYSGEDLAYVYDSDAAGNSERNDPASGWEGERAL